MKFFFAVLLLFTSLFAEKMIEPVIYITTDDINLSHIVDHVTEDKKLASIEENKYTRKMKAVDLLTTLKKLGYNGYKAQSRYIRFVKKSPIDTTKIQNAIVELYHMHYPDIHIKSVDIFPRGFLESLPQNYTVGLHPKSYLSNEGIVFIKSLDNKKIFFDYTVAAFINIYTTKKPLSKDTPLSRLNLTKQKVLLDSFRDAPFILNIDDEALYQTKYNLKAGAILTMRDVEPLSLVKRGDRVSVRMLSETMDIQFSAEALQEGKLNDIITVLNSNNKKIRVRVVGKNRVEMR